MNGLLIYMHYYQAQGADGKELSAATYTQEIEVINRPDALHIRQHFSGLSDIRHEIVWPKASTNRSCYPAEATSCDRLDENVQPFLKERMNVNPFRMKYPKKSL